jgi:hypothetical protein
MRYALCVFTAIALLAGCGGSQSSIGAPGAIPQSPAIATHVERGGSWMLPEAKGRGLLYISVGYLPDRGVYVYSYPKLKRLGMIAGIGAPQGECVDGAGDVFIVDAYTYAVFEYAHGDTSSKATIYTPNFIPESCSIDPTTGQLAVSGIGAMVKGVASIVSVYSHKPHRGWRFPKLYGISSIAGGAFCGYDSTGNLFIDGYAKSGAFELAELLKGTNALTTVTLNQGFQGAGQVQWDGSYLAIGDNGVTPSVIYRFAISRSGGTEVASTTLEGSTYIQQFWIQGSKVIGPDSVASKRGVGFWPYPGGGERNRSIKLYQPFGAVVSPIR